MAQSLVLYWQRLIQRADDSEAPVLDLAGCFGSPVIQGPIINGLGPEAIARLADAAPARSALR